MLLTGKVQMIEFQSFEDVLDFAVLQEKAAQQFYLDLSQKVLDEHVQSFYQEMAQQEGIHEEKLLALKRYEFDLKEPDMESLRQSGYLDAMPISPEATLEEAVRYAYKKERSARMLYHTLSQVVEREELADLFRTLADQEQAHAEFFQTEYRDCLANSKM
jgi:rubrerythrin